MYTIILMDKLEKLKDDIGKAFSSVEIPDTDHIVDTEDPAERKDHISFFGGRRWQDISLDDLIYNSESVFFFLPAAYQYYLPAYLIGARLP